MVCPKYYCYYFVVFFGYAIALANKSQIPQGSTIRNIHTAFLGNSQSQGIILPNDDTEDSWTVANGFGQPCIKLQGEINMILLKIGKIHDSRREIVRITNSSIAKGYCGFFKSNILGILFNDSITQSHGLIEFTLTSMGKAYALETVQLAFYQPLRKRMEFFEFKDLGPLSSSTDFGKSTLCSSDLTLMDLTQSFALYFQHFRFELFDITKDDTLTITNGNRRDTTGMFGPSQLICRENNASSIDGVNDVVVTAVYMNASTSYSTYLLNLVYMFAGCGLLFGIVVAIIKISGFKFNADETEIKAIV